MKLVPPRAFLMLIFGSKCVARYAPNVSTFFFDGFSEYRELLLFTHSFFDFSLCFLNGSERKEGNLYVASQSQKYYNILHFKQL
jgi:hypothetical protein